VLGLLVCSTLSAGALHLTVVKSTPGKDQKLEAPPKRLQVWFSQEPAAAVSAIMLKRESAEIPVGKTVVVAADKSIYADPVKPLENGAYTLLWRTAGDDGHVMSGEIKFAIDTKAAR
jgi:methionine-rich copper-binding protein CopC